MTKLPAPLALKKFILKQVAESYPDFKLPPLNTEDEIQDFYSDACSGDFSGHIQDATQDVRSYGLETSLPAPCSRHYECEVRAIQTDDGWIGYNYWYGGGKFGNEEEIDFISDAYHVSCEEKEVLTIQRTWTKVVT